MKGKCVLILLLFLLACSPSDAHRMMMGYRVDELEITALYDDGTPAAGAKIEVHSDGSPILEGTTDENGTFAFKPGKDMEDITVVSSSAGHRAELSLNLARERQAEEAPLPARVLAGLGYLVGIAGLAMIYVSRKGSKKA